MLRRSTSTTEQSGHDARPLSPALALQLLEEFTSTGTDSALLVTGASGIGKSHVLERLAIQRKAPLVRALPAEQQFALSGLSALLGALHPAMLHELGTHLHLRRDDDAGLYAAAHDIRELIVGLRLAPTVVLLDDLDLLDHQSSIIIATLLSRLSGTNLRIVATATSLPSRFATVPHLHLEELSLDEAERLALEVYPGADPTTLRLLMEYSGRHPVIWRHQLRSLREEQLDGSRPLRLPLGWATSLDDLVVESSRAVGEAEHALLLDVALSPECHSNVLSALHPEADATVTDLLDTGVLHTHGPYVSLADQHLRSSLIHAAPVGQRRERHAALEEATRTVAPHLAAWHRSFVSTDPRVTEGLFAAAAQTVSEGRFPTTVEIAERAFSRWSPGAPCPPVVVDLCWGLQSAGETALAARYGAWALAARSNPMQVLELAAVRMVGSLSNGERRSDAEDEALVTLHGGHHRTEALRLEALVAAAHLAQWEPEGARQVLAHARSVGPDPQSLIGRILHGLDSVADALEGRVESASGTERLSGDSAEELIIGAHQLSLRERYTEARRCLELGLHHPTMHDHAWVSLAHRIALHNEIGAGDFHAARHAIDAWGQDAPWISHPTPASAWATAWRHYSLGDVEAAIVTISRCLELTERECTPAHQAAALALRGTVHLMDYDLDAALADLRDTAVLSRDYPHPALLRHWGDYVETCVYADRPQEARRAVETFAKRMRDRSSRWGTLVLARSQALIAPGTESVQQLTQVVRSLDTAELRSYEGGRTLLCLARQQEATGQVPEARRTAATAATVFAAIGAVGWVARARGQRHRVAQADSGTKALDQLSAHEREIVALVQVGLRNREIAERLYLSLRTVELRLTHIYRTLGIGSRAELIALFGKRAA